MAKQNEYLKIALKNGNPLKNDNLGIGIDLKIC